MVAAPGSNKDREGEHESDAVGHNAPWCSTCFSFDDHDHEDRGWPAGGREICSEEDMGSPTSSWWAWSWCWFGAADI
jgi:hypothetical protein